MADFDPMSTHPQYDSNSAMWSLMRDAIEGEDVVKEAGEDYLPMKSAQAAIADSALQEQSYDAYKLRAEFPEIVAPTIRGSVGTMLSQPAQIELPTVMEFIRERATLDGLTLDALHRRIVIELMSVGRYGLLPSMTEDGVAYFAGYTTECIRNWDVVRPETGWVLLDESGPELDRETGTWSDVESFRECFVEGQAYTSVVWTKEAGGAWVSTPPEVAKLPPKNGQVSPLAMMPFVFINTNDLGANPDDIPLYGLAKLAFRAYRMDADYTFSLHMTSEPTPVAIGYDNPTDAIASGKVPTTLGSSKMWILPVGGDAKYLEFSGPGLSAQQKAIDDTLKRAIVFGAQLFDSKKTAESGEALSLRLGNQHSTLKTVAMTAAAGLERALRNMAIWMGANPDEVVVKPHLDFVDHTLTAQDITALVAGWMSAAYSRSTLFRNLQRGGIIDPDKTIEDERAEIEEDMALDPAPDPDPNADPNTDPNANDVNDDEDPAGGNNNGGQS